MQLVEASSFAVRSAVIQLRRPDTPLGFVLFPMIHLATPAFYAEVMTRLAGCQLIVAEGGTGIERTAGGQALTLSYRLAGRARRWGLVTQRLTLTELGVPVVSPDMDADRFRRGWRRLPVLVRLWAWVLVPAFGIGLLVFGSRGLLVRRLGSQEGLPTREEELGSAALMPSRNCWLTTGTPCSWERWMPSISSGPRNRSAWRWSMVRATCRRSSATSRATATAPAVPSG